MAKVVIEIPTTEDAEQIRELIERHAPQLGLQIDYSKVLLRLTAVTHDESKGE